MMVERVARRLVEETLAATDGPDSPYEQIEIEGRRAAEFLARIAIEAMREPTEQQLFKMSRAAPDVALPVIREIYAAAIDAALAD